MVLQRPLQRRATRAVLCLAVLGLAAPAAAQQPDSTVAPTIDHVAITRYSIFDPNEATFWLLRLVNTLHIPTREYVVRRELLFGAGDQYDSARVVETDRNLRGLGVFRAVQIDTATTDSGLVATVTTRDGWSTRPDFRFRSTGGSVAYTLALIEDNLLGTASQASLLYRKNPDRTTTTLAFRQPRLIAGRVGLTSRWDNRSDGDRVYAAMGQQFFNTETASSWNLAGETRNERILRFTEGEPVPTDSVFREYRYLRFDAGKALSASSGGYVRVGLMGQLRSDNVLTGILPVDDDGNFTTGAVGAWLEWRRTRYEPVVGYRAQGRPESVDLSPVARLGFWVAPTSFGYSRSVIAPDLWLQAGTRFGGGFALVSGVANGAYSSAGLDSGSAQLGATVALIPSPRHLFVLHGSMGVIKNPVPGTEFDLGLGAGPRGFREHAFTGDRMFFGTAEYRYALANDFAKVVDVGLATFFDVGGAWYSGAPRRTGWDAGVGLRLGASRAPDLDANRIDLVYRSGNDQESSGWLLVVAKGFAFSSGLRGEP